MKAYLLTWHAYNPEYVMVIGVFSDFHSAIDAMRRDGVDEIEDHSLPGTFTSSLTVDREAELAALTYFIEENIDSEYTINPLILDEALPDTNQVEL